MIEQIEHSRVIRVRVGRGKSAMVVRDRLTGCQARAARAMLMFSRNDLARHSKLSASSIGRIEGAFGVPENVTLDLLVRLQEYFEGRGFRFSWDGGHGPGVQWANYLGGEAAGSTQDPTKSA